MEICPKFEEKQFVGKVFVRNGVSSDRSFKTFRLCSWIRFDKPVSAVFLGWKYVQNLRKSNFSEKFSAEMKFHQIDPLTPSGRDE
jgi:hypothetical protein